MYQFTSITQNQSPEVIWEKAIKHLAFLESILSIKKVTYTLVNVNADMITYTGDNRSGGKTESIQKTDFIEAVTSLNALKNFTTATAKEILKSVLYRKRGPLFAILLETGIIEKLR